MGQNEEELGEDSSSCREKPLCSAHMLANHEIKTTQEAASGGKGGNRLHLEDTVLHIRLVQFKVSFFFSSPEEILIRRL